MLLGDRKAVQTSDKDPLRKRLQGYNSNKYPLSEEAINPHNGSEPTDVLKNAKKAMKTEVNVAVILGYFNGHTYIREQLKSILQQTHSKIHIYCCDDKSNIPLSIDSLQLNQDEVSKISIVNRSCNLGFTENFLNMLGSIPDKFEYIAFSDQDDIWYENKLEKAITALEKLQLIYLHFIAHEPKLSMRIANTHQDCLRYLRSHHLLPTHLCKI